MVICGSASRRRSYLLVECTGFAATAADGRSSPTLSFAEARIAAASNLSQMDHVATIDVVRLQKAKGYAAYDPPDGPTRPSVYEIVVRNYPALTDFTYDTEFQELVALETASFVGRSWVASELTAFRAASAAAISPSSPKRGWARPRSPPTSPGARPRPPSSSRPLRDGRTWIRACGISPSTSSPGFRCDTTTCRSAPARTGAFLKGLLDEATKQAPQVLLVIDGVDEATDAGGGNTLFLPAQMPNGVHVVLTARVEPVITVSGPDEDADGGAPQPTTSVSGPTSSCFSPAKWPGPTWRTTLREHGVEREAFIDRLGTASAGNFMFMQVRS